MKPDRRSYNAAYKAEAVRLAVERDNVTSVARDLGIGSTTLQRWVDLSTEHPENPFPGNGNARDAEMHVNIGRKIPKTPIENSPVLQSILILAAQQSGVLRP
jgi:transposase